jgi:hypothetical protein
VPRFSGMGIVRSGMGIVEWNWKGGVEWEWWGGMGIEGWGGNSGVEWE